MNVRPETIKLLEENIGSKLLDTGPSNNFLALTPKAKAIKAEKKKIKWDYIRLKILPNEGNHQKRR